MGKETDQLNQIDAVEPVIPTATPASEYGQISETSGTEEVPTGQITDITYNQEEQDSSFQRHRDNKTRSFDPNSRDDLAGLIKQRPDWRDRMACTGRSDRTDLFIPPSGKERKRPAADRVEKALAICASCVARPQCYANTMLSNVRFIRNVVVAGHLGQDISDLRKKIK